MGIFNDFGWLKYGEGDLEDWEHLEGLEISGFEACLEI
jgi:hypothetical protein